VNVSQPRALRAAIDWGRLAPLRLRARHVAEGVYAGAHRSARRGAGVEFGGFREYVPGDDLRWLDRRSLLLHDRLVIRQFETETDRALALLVDASASMAFRSSAAPAAKLAFASLVGAALSHVALSSGDPAGVTFFGGEGATAIPRSGGREHFERIVAGLEAMRPGGDATLDTGMLDRALQAFVRTLRRGAIVVVLSDLLDMPPGAAERVAALASNSRALAVVQIVDPAELQMPYSGTVRLRALEGNEVVETDADEVRLRYQAAFQAITDQWRDAVVRRGGRFLRASTTDDPVGLVRAIASAIR
jgi:uncharacterized protein (DUF58 family)